MSQWLRAQWDLVSPLQLIVTHAGYSRNGGEVPGRGSGAGASTGWLPGLEGQEGLVLHLDNQGL